MYQNIPSEVIALCSEIFSIINIVYSINEVISNTTEGNLDTLLNTRTYCASSKMIHIILSLDFEI